MIPIQPTKKRFNTLNSKINNFYWKNKIPRISINTVQKKIKKIKNKTMGGLGPFSCTVTVSLTMDHHFHNPRLDSEQAECKRSHALLMQLRLVIYTTT